MKDILIKAVFKAQFEVVQDRDCDGMVTSLASYEYSSY